ncbi:response regulator [Desulfovibrio gilichinskyi]|uniref:Two-component system, cell cycle response regulator DivK n=1 Tax=Desulfovibrio gilichinskyi TaxID=1519643 RepID=A0A1X7EX70_9BACT|nr:response regulator [Desulfovibrio gilichinskyi]SMF41750.1 two-component system, cell cycle response regulator DivK [Desulfovibrio gilichinskyi]
MKKILIVEDDLKSCKLVRDLLEVLGFTTIEADNGVTGVRMAESDKPDLILMDVQLPHMNGVDATRALKSNSVTSKIPVIGVSAHSMRGDDAKMLNAGADGYISKPIDTRLLIKTIKDILKID